MASFLAAGSALRAARENLPQARAGLLPQARPLAAGDLAGLFGPGGTACPELPPRVSASRLALGLVCILAYVVGTPLLGFPLATTGFIVAFMVVAGARSAPGIAATALLGTVSLLYAFIKLVYLPFPKGAGRFEGVTLALYRALGIF